MSALVRYEQARTALAECARIDEASEIRDKAAALAAYARQRDDRDLEVWVREIHLRACVRIGELSRDIEGVERRRGEHGRLLPTDGNQVTKAQALAEAGLSTTAAARYEELAGVSATVAAMAGDRAGQADRRVADNNTEANHKRVLEIIRTAGEISRNALVRKTQFLSKREREEIFDALVEGELVARSMKPTGTKPLMLFSARGTPEATGGKEAAA
jgi:hypothetical protein